MQGLVQVVANYKFKAENCEYNNGHYAMLVFSLREWENTLLDTHSWMTIPASVTCDPRFVSAIVSAVEAIPPPAAWTTSAKRSAVIKI